MPWTGLIPTEDVAAFARGFKPEQRAIDAGTRPALVIVDMTRAFVDSRYTTGHAETGQPAVRANLDLLTAFRNAGLPVFFTKAYGDPGHVPTAGERGRWNTSIERESETLPPGDVIVDALTPIPGEHVINKGQKPSGFFGTPLTSLLIEEKVDTVVVTGMTTSGCVRATVLDAFQYNYHVVVPIECVADRSQISHKINLFDLHMKYADVAPLDEVRTYVEHCVSSRP